MVLRRDSDGYGTELLMADTSSDLRRVSNEFKLILSRREILIKEDNIVAVAVPPRRH